MSIDLKIMIFVNVVLALLFVCGSVAVWMASNGHAVWANPLWITYRATPPGEMAGFVLIPNYPFMLFWISTIVNVFFIIRLQRSKATF